MALIELLLDGTRVDRVERSIARLREFEPPEGYYLAFSGGKDSQVIYDLAERAEVKFDAHMNLTSVDPPEVIRFVREHYPAVSLDRPQTTMWAAVLAHRCPPLRQMRYCCRELKEVGGAGRFVVTGVRWAESIKRKKRAIVETFVSHGIRKQVLNPILDWETSDVWDYLNARGLPHCSLYDEGRTRIGCIMCPNSGRRGMRRDAARWPKFAAAYRLACRRVVEDLRAQGLPHDWKDGDDLYERWLSGKMSLDTEQGCLLYE
jgi:phosphoadenosine phosphosulfate reductase